MRNGIPEGGASTMSAHLFGDRYQIGDTLGYGGMSEVHRGRDLRLGRDVAVKVLRADLARDPSFQTRFRREAQNAASLNHPAIVAVYDTGEIKSDTGIIPYIVMEYVDGDTLRDTLKAEGPLAPRRAMEITADICAALDFSHRHGIVHRDIKPANIMLNRAGAVKVMDFGIARAVADGQATMTATAAVIGTAQYLSPEQARGESVDARSDVYATGCVLFELLTGSPPFTGDSPVAIAYQHVREQPKAPSELRPELPRDLDAIVLKALNKNPLNRYQTAAEMRSDLVRSLSGHAVLATPKMSDEERTQMLRAAPVKVGSAAAAPAPLLAPPRQVLSEMWEEEDRPRSRAKKVWSIVGVSLLCLALLAGAIFVTLQLTKKAPTVAQVAVPSVETLDGKAATTQLTKAGFKVVSTKAESAKEQKDTVIRQEPSAGVKVDPGSTINIVIGTGPGSVTVPNLTDYSAVQAKASLESAGLTYHENDAASDGPHKDKVIRQDPPPNQSVTPGTKVEVFIGTGPDLTPVPAGLKGKMLADVKALLAKAKLQATVDYVDSVDKKDTVLDVQDSLGSSDLSKPMVVGSVLVLKVSNQSQFTVPNITQLSPDAAAAELVKAGWTYGSKLTPTDTPVVDQSQYNVILTQGVPAGKVIPRNYPIPTTKGVVKQVPPPPVVPGSKIDVARAVCAAASVQCVFNVSEVTVEDQGLANTVSDTGTANGEPISSHPQYNWDQVFVFNVTGNYKPKPTPTPSPTPSPQPGTTVTLSNNQPIPSGGVVLPPAGTITAPGG